jgi:hypothetical protein
MLEYLNAMNRTFKSLSFILSFLFLIRTSSHGQVNQKDNYNLDLTNTEGKIENIIRLYISDSQYENLRSTTGEKVNIKSSILIINGDTIKPKEISTRGQSTLMFRRKSLGIRLKSAELYPFYSDEDIISNSKLGNYKDASLENLRDYLLSIYLTLSASRENHLAYLKNLNN